MTNVCVNLLVNEFGFSTEKAKSLIQALDVERMKLEASYGSSDIRAKLSEALDKNVEKAKIEQLRSKRRKYIDLNNTAIFLENMQNRVKANPKMPLRKVVEAEMVGAEKVALSGDSIALSAKTTSELKVGKLFSDFKSEGISGKLLRDISFSKNVSRSLLGESSPDKSVRAATRILRDAMDKVYVQARAAGIDIGYYENYLPQRWDATKISKVSPEEFVDDLKKVVDVTGWEDPEKVLLNIYHNLRRGFRLEDLTTQRGIINAFKGSRLTKNRVLRIEDPQNWYDIAKKYGDPDGIKSTISYLQNNFYTIGMVNRGGLHPEQNLVKASKLLMIDNPKRIDDLKKLEDAIEGTRFKRNRRLGQLWVNVDKSVHNPVDPSSYVYKTIQFARWLQTTSKLGGAAISAMADVFIMSSQLQYGGISLLKAYGNLLKRTFSRVPKGLSGRKVAEYVGIYGENVGADIVNRFDPLYGLPGALNDLQNKFFKWSGLTPWTNHMRSNMAAILSHDFAIKTKEGWEQLPRKFKKILNDFNIKKNEFISLQNNKIQAENGQWFMDFESIEDEALKNKMYRFFAHQVEGGVLRPDAADTFYLNWGQQNGTLLGYIVRLGTQFKSFSFTFGRRHLIPATREAFQGNYGYIANLLVGSLVFGYLASAAKDILKGRTPKDLTKWETLMQSMAQGGGLGIYGDFLFRNVDRFGNNIWETIAGPTASSAATVAKWGINTIHGEPPSIKEVTQWGVRNMPFANLWYTRSAMNYLFLYGLYEHLQPGYIRKYKDFLKRETGQEFLIDPLAW
jgi:hypothetical protein